MTYNFEAKLVKVGPRAIIRLPIEVSEKLPSRGMVMICGTINNISFQAPLEPDGKGSHWMEVTHQLSDQVKVAIGDTVTIDIEPIDDWMEPEVAKDIMDAFIKEGVIDQWKAITPKAKWQWIRWIRFTANPKTRSKRIGITCSKLQNGDKRPCCFDYSRCTVTDVSRSGVLLDK